MTWLTWVALGSTALAAVLGWRAAAVARRRERRLLGYRRLAERLPGVVLVFDRRLRHVRAAGRGLELLGLGGGLARGRTLGELFDEEARHILMPAYRAALDGEESQLELPLGDRDWVVTISPAGHDTGILVAADVTDRKRRERRLTELASRDSLTGAWNRRRLQEELDWLLARGGDGAVLLLDLDRFKLVNDTLGHHGGDELLRQVAIAVQGCVRRSDLVARVGGDEFAVLLPGATPVEAEQVAAKIEAAVSAVWPLGIAGGVSVGISSAASGDALAHADRAMYAAKHLRRAS